MTCDKTPFKKNNPGNPCCGCIPETINAESPASKWTNVDDEWTANGTTWETDVAGAAMLATKTLGSTVNQAVVFELAIVADCVTRCLFWYEDSSNFWALEHEYTYDVSDSYASRVRIIQVVGGSETVIQEANSAATYQSSTAVRFRICFTPDSVTVEATEYIVSLSGWMPFFRFGRPDLVAAGFSSPTVDTRAGVVAVSVVGGELTELRSIEFLCDEPCVKPCVRCDDDWGPRQYQLVLSGFTGSCAIWNGTYVVDAEWYSDSFGTCRWLFATDTGDVRSIQVVLNSSGSTRWSVFLASATATLFFYYPDSADPLECGAIDNLDLGTGDGGSSGCWTQSGHAYLTAL